MMQKSIKATAAVVRSRQLEKVEGYYKINVPGSLSEIKNVCPQEAFADEPVFSACSAFLISSDTYISSLFCHPEDCSNSKIMFSTLDQLEVELFQCPRFIPAKESLNINGPRLCSCSP